MAKIESIAAPFKKTYEVDLLKPIKNLYSSRLQNESIEKYIININEFSKLRTNAVCRTLEFHESSLDTIYRYYDQLASLDSKLNPTELPIPFKWKDAFDKGSIFGGKITLTLTSLSYERVCVLFNIAALESQIAAAQSSESDEGLKTQTKLFQSSSGLFSYLKTVIKESLDQELTPDLQPETLTALTSVMLAQAHEAITHKARMDNMKDIIVAKLLSRSDELFAEALRNLQKERVKPLWDRDWVLKFQKKQIISQAYAQYYQSRVCKSEKLIGQEIARLKYTIELFKNAQTKCGDATLFNEEIGRAQRALNESVKDNDFIYHERVPDVKALDPIVPLPMARPLTPPIHFTKDFKDLFEDLAPMVIQQAISQFNLRKTTLINEEVATLRENTHLLNSILISLNLPAAIEDVSGEKLPQSLKDKADTICKKGGVQYLEKLLNELPELLERNKELLEESLKQLTEERQSDAQLRAQFKEKWTRATSASLTGCFVTNYDKYKKVIDTAMQADKTIKEKYETHKEGITLLSGGPESLAAYLPNASNSSNVSSAAVEELRKLMKEDKDLKSERDKIEKEIRDVKLDMKDKFLQEFTKGGGVNEAELSVEALTQAYQGYQEKVKESVTKQESLVAKIQTAYNEFSGGGSSNNGDREEKLKKLAAAYDSYMELIDNMQEGIKFYNDLTQLLVNYQSKINDFCFARKTEKDELMKDLTLDFASLAMSTPPTPPSHHIEASDSESKSAPPRPPPPQANPYQGAPQSATAAAPNPYQGAPQSATAAAPNPYQGAPQSATAAAAAPASAFTAVHPKSYDTDQYHNPPHTIPAPYPLSPVGMPAPQSGYNQYMRLPIYTPMPQGYNPYHTPIYQSPPYPANPYSGYPYPPQLPNQPPNKWPPKFP